MQYNKILIVDDSATSRMIVKRCFEIAGFSDVTYIEAEDGLKAIRYIQENDVDLIISDIKMPKMDGTTFIRKLKLLEGKACIPVIVVSSIGNESLEEELKKVGVKAVIKKPLNPAKVLDFMEEDNE